MMMSVIASEAKQSRSAGLLVQPGLLRRFAPRNDRNRLNEVMA
jgi:hypothetical protein